jgi:hypothetical protein
LSFKKIQRWTQQQKFGRQSETQTWCDFQTKEISEKFQRTFHIPLLHFHKVGNAANANPKTTTTNGSVVGADTKDVTVAKIF